jgi:hypothetical protein
MQSRGYLAVWRRNSSSLLIVLTAIALLRQMLDPLFQRNISSVATLTTIIRKDTDAACPRRCELLVLCTKHGI